MVELTAEELAARTADIFLRCGSSSEMFAVGQELLGRVNRSAWRGQPAGTMMVTNFRWQHGSANFDCVIEVRPVTGMSPEHAARLYGAVDFMPHLGE